MKKWIVGVLALFAFTGLKAQDSNVLSAWEYMSTYNSEKWVATWVSPSRI